MGSEVDVRLALPLRLQEPTSKMKLGMRRTKRAKGTLMPMIRMRIRHCCWLLLLLLITMRRTRFRTGGGIAAD